MSTPSLDLKEIGSQQIEESIQDDASDDEGADTFQQLTKALNLKLDSQQK